jgi:hypothetical protein
MPAAFFAIIYRPPRNGPRWEGTVRRGQSRNDTPFTFVSINVFIRIPFCQTMRILS